MRASYKKELKDMVEVKMMRNLIGKLDSMTKAHRDSIPSSEIQAMIKQMRKDIEQKAELSNELLKDFL